MKSNKLVRLTVKNNPAFHVLLSTAYMKKLEKDIISSRILVLTDYDKHTIEISGDIESVGDNQKNGLSVLQEFEKEKRRVGALKKAELIIEIVEAK